ncbi:hypothetical protein GGI35DRAFT_463883, partial [Trichoderma velutinum]
NLPYKMSGSQSQILTEHQTITERYTITQLVMYLESQTSTDPDDYIAELVVLVKSYFTKYRKDGSKAAEQIKQIQSQKFPECGSYIVDRIKYLDKNYINYPWIDGEKFLLKRFGDWAKKSGVLLEDLQSPGDVVFSEGPQREMVFKAMMRLAIYIDAAIWDFEVFGIGALVTEQNRFKSLMNELEKKA